MTGGLRRWLRGASTLVISLSALLSAAAPSGAGGIVHVPENVWVDGPALRLGEMASFDGLPPQLESQLAALSFGPSGEPGSSQTLLGARVREAVHAIDAALWVEVPERIGVRRSGVQLTGDVLRQRIERAIRHVMPWPDASVTLERWSVPAAIWAPRGHTRLLVRFAPGERFVARTATELELLDPSQPQVPGVRASASVQIRVRLPVAVAARTLRRGETLTADAIEMRLRSLEQLGRDAITQVQDVLGQTLATTVREGAALRRAHLGADPVVQRGDALRVDASQGALQLTLEAVALERGRVDQVIRARNPDTRRELAVRVTGPREGRLASLDGGAR